MKKVKIITVIIVLLGIFIFFFIGWGFFQEPRQSQKREAERIKKIAENNPEIAEKLKLWKEGKIELSQEDINEINKIFYGNKVEDTIERKRQSITDPNKNL